MNKTKDIFKIVKSRNNYKLLLICLLCLMSFFLGFFRASGIEKLGKREAQGKFIIQKLMGEVTIGPINERMDSRHIDSSLILEGEVVISWGEEVLLAPGSKITLVNIYDGFVLHLAGEAYLSLKKNKGFYLKKGMMWLQTLKQSKKYSLKTVNSLTTFNEGEAIISYDSEKEKTQLLVVENFWDIRDIAENYKEITLEAGQFSFIQNKEGLFHPREPTFIGDESFVKMNTLFEGLEPHEKKQIKAIEKRRGKQGNLFLPKKISGNNKNSGKQNGQLRKMIYEKSLKKLDQNFADLLPKTRKKYKVLPKSFVPVIIYNDEPLEENSEVIKRKKRRRENNLKKSKRKIRHKKIHAKRKMKKNKIKSSMMKEDEFFKSYQEQAKGQKKHSPSIEGLIQELDSMKDDNTHIY